MATRANKYKKNKHNKTKKNKKMKKGKRWVTAINAAQKELNKSGSLNKARQALKVQALSNARKLFGSVGEQM